MAEQKNFVLNKKGFVTLLKIKSQDIVLKM